MKPSDRLKEIQQSAPNSKYDDTISYKDVQWLIARVKILTEALEEECICRSNPLLVAAGLIHDKRPKTCPACKALEGNE